MIYLPSDLLFMGHTVTKSFIDKSQPWLSQGRLSEHICSDVVLLT